MVVLHGKLVFAGKYIFWNGLNTKSWCCFSWRRYYCWKDSNLPCGWWWYWIFSDKLQLCKCLMLILEFTMPSLIFYSKTSMVDLVVKQIRVPDTDDTVVSSRMHWNCQIMESTVSFRNFFYMIVRAMKHIQRLWKMRYLYKHNSNIRISIDFTIDSFSSGLIWICFVSYTI